MIKPFFEGFNNWRRPIANGENLQDGLKAAKINFKSSKRFLKINDRSRSIIVNGQISFDIVTRLT